MGMKYKDPTTGQLKELSLKAADTLPIGTIVDYDGQDVPEGWEQVPEYKANPYIIKEQTENIIHYTNTSSWSCIPLTTDVKTYGDFSSWSFPTGGTNINRIVVGNNASKIRITVDIAVRGDNCSGWCMLGIYKGTNTSNEVQMKKTIANIPNGGWGNLHLDYILDVSENDLISIKIMKDVAGTFDISSLSTSFGDAPLNTLTIEILED